jgi:heat shock protein HslJ
MKLADLDDIAPPEPDDDDLARVRARCRTLRTRRRVGIATALVAVIVVAGSVAIASQGRSGSRVRVAVRPTAGANPSSGSPSITGTWTPQSVAGYRGRISNWEWTPVLRFDSKGNWSGSDGCNDMGGSYQLQAGGAFHATGPLSQTQVLCSAVFPTVAVLHSTARVERRNDQLIFLGADVHVVATYASVAPQPRNTPGTTAGARDVSAEAAIRGAFLGWIDAQPHDAAGPYVQDFASIVGAVRRGMAQHSAADLARYSGRVDSVAIVDATHASVRYSILFDSSPQYADQPGEAIKVGGVWMVSRATVCHLLTYGGITC